MERRPLVDDLSAAEHIEIAKPSNAVTLPGVIEDVVADIERQRALEMGRLHADVSRAPARAIDPERLGWAVDELLDNAGVHGATDQPVEITAGPTSDGTWLLRVSSGGEGRWPDDPGDAFAPFHTTAAGHTGIGLTIVQAVAVAHGGRAFVEVSDGAPRSVVGIELPA